MSALATVVTGIASADAIFVSTLPESLTDITDTPIAMTPFTPGTNGIPLDAVLQSFTVSFNQTILGDETITNSGLSSSNVFTSIESQGLVYLFTSTPGGDLPIVPPSAPSDDSFGGAGPDPTYTKNLTGLAPGGSFSTSYNKSASAVTGTISDPTSLSLAQSAWNAYVDTATFKTVGSGDGDGGATYTNNVEGSLTVDYSYIEESGAPEPTTMVLFGGALVALGAIRKRVRSK